MLATAGTDEKLARAIELGASHVCNNRTGDVMAWVREVTDGRGVDVVFDHVGTALFESSVFALGVGGRRRADVPDRAHWVALYHAMSAKEAA